jgi:hypothetical protein
MSLDVVITGSFYADTKWIVKPGYEEVVAKFRKGTK